MSGEIHYVPTFDGFTLGNAKVRFAYIDRPGLFQLKGRIQMGSTSRVEGRLRLTLPHAIEPVRIDQSVQYIDVSTNTIYPGEIIHVDDGLTLALTMPRFFERRGTFILSPVTGVVPFIWSTKDEIRLSLYATLAPAHADA